MRILVISDIHGNREALETVASREYHSVICLGDVVGYGPEPKACVDWVRENATWVVQGNHDRANADNVPPRCQPNFAWLADAVVPLTRAQLDDRDRAFLHELPRWAVREIDGVRMACFHAKPSDPLYGYLKRDPELWAGELKRVEADLLLVGHTHVPMDLTIGRQRVINPGSVGQPKHGDARAAFAIIENGTPRLDRADYRVDRTVAALESSHVDRQAVAVLSEILRTGTTPPDEIPTTPLRP